MKKFNKIFSLMALSAVCTLTGCIDETFPENGTATAEQVGASAAALEASLSGIPSQMAQGYYVYGEQVHETDMAYPQFMIAQTEMLGDMYPLGSNSGYDWYRNYNTADRNFGDNSYFAYLPWFTLYRFIKAANDVIITVNMDDESVSAQLKGMAGAAYAMRAFDYYMLMVLFEPVENRYTDVSKVKGLTVPIVTENTKGEDSKNNPRVTHDELMTFILNDLDIAEKALSNWTPSTKSVPDLSVVYAIRAKVHMWDQDYANAAKYARLSIDAATANGAKPMTADEWEDPTTAFARATSGWMWYLHYDAENMGNLCNFTGWMSGEADWGYSSLTFPSIDASLYNAINATDFRKHVFLDPAKYDFYEYKTVRDRSYIENAPAHLSLKFRCLNGDWETYSVGGAIDVPVIRLEEMQLLEIEAIGMTQGASAGVQKLNEWMKSYRDPQYSFTTSDQRDFQIEVLTQERIEFWGEGCAFPNAKRIKPGVMQNYEGTNAPADIFKINCEGIKPWWNLVIPISEVNNNNALKGWNNPDPTITQTSIKTPSPVGQYSN